MIRWSERYADLGLEKNVLFTGWTSEIPEILSLCHFTILPSENEALGIVLMEGMAAGTPIIAREREGGAELIEEYDTGFLFKPNEGMSSLTAKVIALFRDGSHYHALSGRCKANAIDNFSLPRFGGKLLDSYQNLQ